MEKYCDSLKNITVVGNGPISENDRQKINDGKCVLRFNDMKNKRQGDKVSFVAVRDNMYNHVSTDVPLLPIITDFNRSLPKTNLIIDPPVVAHEPYLQNQNNKIDDRMLFSECKESKHHSETIHGPSSGALVLDYLNSDPRIEYIHVYGMNWNAGKFHVDFKYPGLVKTCCDKCVFHDTNGASYEP